MRIERRIIASGAVIVAIMTVAALVPYRMHEQVTQVLEALGNAAVSERTCESLLDTLNMADGSQRAYLITGRPEFLQDYLGALAALKPVRATLRAQPTAAPGDATHIDRASMELETDAVLSELDQGLHGRPAALVSPGSLPHLERLRRLIGAEIAVHNQDRERLRARLSKTSSMAVDASMGAAILNILILLPALAAARRALRERAVARERARSAARALRSTANAARRHSDFLTACSRLLNALQLVEGMEETSSVIGAYAKQIFPRLDGALYLYRHSRDALERRGAWGSEAWPAAFDPTDCWALRRGGPHWVCGEEAVACAHSGAASHALCVPLVSHGDVIGTLHLQGPSLGDGDGAQLREWIAQLAGQLALALSGVELRARLRRQSFVDPLTELYNRRYLDETFRRELARAERQRLVLSVVMIDLDHFKRVNDCHGHEAGDVLLSRVGGLLREHVRTADTACRYGGEEMLVLMPDCGYRSALERAEELRAQIAAIRQPSPMHGVLSPTASLGVASYPLHGRDVATLIAAADAALYRAKHGGRNQVCGAASEDIKSSESPEQLAAGG